jgi:hypothetical protein
VVAEDTASGGRADLDRVYVLRRGPNAVYFIDYEIYADGFDVRFKAEDGEGQRPVIYLIENASARFPGEHFRIAGSGGDLWLKDLIMVGYIEALPDGVGSIPSGLIRVEAAGFDIYMEGCLLTQNRGQMIRTNYACRTIKVVDCVWTNMGDLGRSNFGAGKGVDLRAGSCDTLMFINTTFVNFMDRIIRHRSSTAALNNLIFDHNTIINGTSYHGTLALGWVGTKVQITNNLFVDHFILGNDTDLVRQSEFDESGELDEYGFAAMNWIASVPNDTTEWEVSNNYFTVSDSVNWFYDHYAADGVTGVGNPLTHHINAKLGADSATAFTEEALTLAATPDVPIRMAVWYREPWGANKTKETTNFVRERDDYDRRPWQYMADTLDASYATDANAYTAADGGFPVGDLNWFPTKKAEWIDWVVGIEDDFGNGFKPADFTLEQNYPNPFNPTTNINFSIPKADKVELTIYNTMGQKIATLLNKKMNAGNHHVEWNAANVASGIYFYHLKYGNASQTKKMILMK